MDKRKILVTGAGGFIGRNLTAALRNREVGEVLTLESGSDQQALADAAAACDFVYHLAGVNRPDHPDAFDRGNRGVTASLLAALTRCGNRCPVMLASSVQAALDNPYGRSKRAAEELVAAHARETGAKALIYRFPNVFGKWCRPDYNSVVATFCHHMARDEAIRIDDPDRELTLLYIDDLVEELLRALDGRETRESGDRCAVPVTHRITLGRLADTLRSFRESRSTLAVPDMGDPLTKKLYSTYLSYLPEDRFAYPLQKHEDARGSFTEMLRTPDRGQVSVNVAKPGIVKGNHWHDSKNEKFLVMSGRGMIRFRRVGDDRVIEVPVDGEHPTVVDIPTGYTHQIENVGQTDLVTVMWANEPFDPEHPDTWFLPV